MTVGVISVEEQAVSHLTLHRSLQRAVVGIDRILPNAETTVVLIQAAAHPEQRPAEIVDKRGASRRQRPGLTVDVFRAEQLVTGSADVLYINNGFRQDLALDVQVEVIDVRIANSLGEDDSSEERGVCVARIPTFDIAVILSLVAGSLVSYVRAAVGDVYRYRRILCVDSRAVKARRTVNDV